MSTVVFQGDLNRSERQCSSCSKAVDDIQGLERRGRGLNQDSATAATSTIMYTTILAVTITAETLSSCSCFEGTTCTGP